MGAFQSKTISLSDIQENIVGYHQSISLWDGTEQRYINFDNAASTPSLKPVLDKVDEFMEWYSSIHRGTGFKSQLCSGIYDEAREIVAEYLNLEIETHSIIFVKNTTEAINKLSFRFPFKEDQVVLVSKMEHHSNDLPWRARAEVVHIDVLGDGRLDEDDLVQKLKKYRGKIALVSITGASNVTGWVNDVNRLAELCHEHGTRIMVDAAQLAPHRAIDMRSQNDPGHIDFLAFSAHKMYAPFGSGVLIGDKDFFENGDPEYVGGGTVDIVSWDTAFWTAPPEKEEAGTPNVVGVVALAKTLLSLQEIGMDNIAEHEKILTRYILKHLQDIPGITIYGSSDPDVVDNRLGVVTLNVGDLPHALTAAILNFEGGIGVRNGCFCAHPYIKTLLNVSEEEAQILEQQLLNGDRSRIPGAVRISFGMYNTESEIDAIVSLLRRIATGNYNKNYVLDRARGEYNLKGYTPVYSKYFRL